MLSSLKNKVRLTRPLSAIKCEGGREKHFAVFKIYHSVYLYHIPHAYNTLCRPSQSTVSCTFHFMASFLKLCQLLLDLPQARNIAIDSNCCCSCCCCCDIVVAAHVVVAAAVVAQRDFELESNNCWHISLIRFTYAVYEQLKASSHSPSLSLSFCLTFQHVSFCCVWRLNSIQLNS